MKDALIVSPLRTPIGKFGGALAPLTADRLAATLIQTLMARLDVPPASLDEVIVAQSYASSEAPCMGRYAALAAGLPIEAPGYMQRPWIVAAAPACRPWPTPPCTCRRATPRRCWWSAWRA